MLAKSLESDGNQPTHLFLMLVISPILVFIYIDGLLVEFEKSDVGCFMGVYMLGHLAMLITSNC